MAYIAVIGEGKKTLDKKSRVTRRHTVKRKIRLGFISLTAVTVTLSCVLTILYFLQVQRLTLSGYEISDLEQQVREIREENRKLQYDLSQNKALTIIQKAATEELQMVPATDVQYWWGQNNELAVRQ